MKIVYILILAFAAVILFIVPLDRDMKITPINASDSDGKFSDDIINGQKSGEYFLILKNYPYGYVEMTWNVTSKETVIDVNWTLVEGGGNVYVGYYNNSGWTESGPFNEDGNFTLLVDKSIGGIKFRFRGEDEDFGVDAIAWVSTQLTAKKQVYGLAGLLL